MSPLVSTRAGISARGYGLFSAAAAVGDFESIATVNGTGSSGTISFTSIPSTYKHLQIRVSGTTGASSVVNVTFNSDTGSNYARHRLTGDGASVGAVGSATQTAIPMQGSSGLAPSTSVQTAFVIDILDYANTNKYKTLRSLDAWDNNGSGMVEFLSGLWQNTNAISTITLTTNTGNWTTASSFALYGIKG